MLEYTSYKHERQQTIKELFKNTKTTFKKFLINSQTETKHNKEHRSTINITKLNKRNEI